MSGEYRVPKVKWQNTIKNKDGLPVKAFYKNYYQGPGGTFSGQKYKDQFDADEAARLKAEKAAQVKQANEWVDKTGSQIGNVNKHSRHYSKVNTKNLDTNDPEAVKRIQESLVSTGALPATYIDKDGNEVSSIDGKFGPMTEKAYRGEITKSREDMGLSGYKYDNLLDNADKTEIITKEGQDGEYWDPKTNSWQKTMTDYNPDLSLEENKKIHEDNQFSESLGLENEGKIVGYNPIDGAPMYEGDETGGTSVLQPDEEEEEKSFGDQVYDYFSSWWN